MRALVYGESRRGRLVYGTLGSRRWECEHYELTAKAKARRDADPDNYEHDRDVDEVASSKVFPIKEAALAYAKTVAPGSVYGCAIVQQQMLEWFVEEDGVAEWEPTGPQFEVDANGEVAEI